MLGRVKRLEAHPVKELWGTDKFLRVLQAAQEGLITYRLEVIPRPPVFDKRC